MIITIISNIVFLFIGIGLGYFLFSPRAVSDRITTIRKDIPGVIPRRRTEIGQVEPITAEEYRKQNTSEGQEEIEMEKTFGRILERERKYKT